MKDEMDGWIIGFIILLGIALFSVVITGTYRLTSHSPSQSQREGKTNQIASPSPTQNAGEKIFSSKCTACHTYGGGDKIGPDLKGVTKKRKREWILRFVKEPDKVLAAKDPIAMKLLKKFNNVPMAPLGLSDAQVEEVVNYLAKRDGSPISHSVSSKTPESSPPSSTTSVSLSSLPQGDMEKGREYFRGERSFQNGGAACISCHNVKGEGRLGGGTLGPDLTRAYKKFNGEGLFVWFEGSPIMKPIFQKHPVTQEEKSHLLAYFAHVAKQQEDQSGGKGLAAKRNSKTAFFLSLGVGLWLFFLFLTFLFWGNRRLLGVRKSLVEQAKI